MAEGVKGDKLTKKSADKGKQKLSKRTATYFKEVRSELKKVVWPTWPQLFNNTFTVLMFCLILAILICAFDFGISLIADKVYSIK